MAKAESSTITVSRARIAAAIEKLIAALDRIDGDADLEVSEGDEEADDGEDGADDEPSLGWNSAARPFCDGSDREEDFSEVERETPSNIGRRYGGRRRAA